MSKVTIEIYRTSNKVEMYISKLTSDEWDNIVVPSLEKIALDINNKRKDD